MSGGPLAVGWRIDEECGQEDCGLLAVGSGREECERWAVSGGLEGLREKMEEASGYFVFVSPCCSLGLLKRCVGLSIGRELNQNQREDAYAASR